MNPMREPVNHCAVTANGRLFAAQQHKPGFDARELSAYRGAAPKRFDQVPFRGETS